MPRSSGGVYTPPAGSAAVGGETISANAYNNLISDIGTEITQSVPRNGAAGMTGPFKLADGTVGSPGVAFGSATNTGAYKTSDGIGIAVNGVLVAKFTSSGATSSDGTPYAETQPIAWETVNSGGTVDLSATSSPNVWVEGTTTITSFGTAASGFTRRLHFNGSLLLTYSSSLILPGGLSIYTTPGDVLDAVSQAGGVWRVVSYSRASGMPVAGIGMPSFWPTSTPPAWALERNGAAVSRATYAALFAVIGTQYGSGDGSTTFNLPDDRGIFERGYDNGRGIDSGRVFGSEQADALKSHTHTVGLSRTAFAGSIAGTAVYLVDSSNTTTSATGDTETRPRNRAYLPIIRFA